MGKNKLLEKLSKKDQEKLKKLQALLQESESESDNEEQTSKKQKVEKSISEGDEDNDNDNELSDLSDLDFSEPKKQKKATKIIHGKKKDGAYSFDLQDPKKKIQVSKFKGHTYISLREFYEKDGDFLPTKKGCSMKIDQWKFFKKIVNEIDLAIQEID